MMKYLSDLNWWKQAGALTGGVLTAVWVFLASMNIHYEWFTDKSISAFVSLIIAVGSFFVTILATFINTFLTKKSKEKAAQIVDDYKAELKAEADAEMAKLKAAIAQLEAEKNQQSETTPSTEGPVSTTNTTVQ